MLPLVPAVEMFWARANVPWIPAPEIADIFCTPAGSFREPNPPESGFFEGGELSHDAYPLSRLGSCPPQRFLKCHRSHQIFWDHFFQGHQSWGGDISMEISQRLYGSSCSLHFWDIGPCPQNAFKTYAHFFSPQGLRIPENRPKKGIAPKRGLIKIKRTINYLYLIKNLQECQKNVSKKCTFAKNLMIVYTCLYENNHTNKDSKMG